MGQNMRLAAAVVALVLGLQAAWLEAGGHRLRAHRRASGPGQEVVGDQVAGQIAQAESRPSEVLIEATIAEVGVDKDAAESGLKFSWFSGSGAEYIKALSGFAEVEALIAPRLMVRDKQRAEICIGDELGRKSAAAEGTAANDTAKHLPTGTQLKVRPFVSPEGTIRLEVHAEYSTGNLDGSGVPQTHTTVITANLMMADGATVVMYGPIDSQATQQDEGTGLASWIPGVKRLFGDKEEAAGRKQLVVVLTPRVWRPEMREGLAEREVGGDVKRR
jgi:type II secretory pathway component GspD/PulD (secretin)